MLYQPYIWIYLQSNAYGSRNSNCMVYAIAFHFINFQVLRQSKRIRSVIWVLFLKRTPHVVIGLLCCFFFLLSHTLTENFAWFFFATTFHSDVCMSTRSNMIWTKNSQFPILHTLQSEESNKNPLCFRSMGFRHRFFVRVTAAKETA